MYWRISIGIVILVLLACQEEIDSESLKESYLENKIADYEAYKRRACRKKLYEMADLKADSFFEALSKTTSFDSTYRAKPIQKPKKPKVEIREDSVELKPIVDSF